MEIINKNHKDIVPRLKLKGEPYVKLKNVATLYFSSNAAIEFGLMEGLYIKWEEDGIVKGRYKFVRPDFVQQLQEQDEHWHDRPILPNTLAEGIKIF